MTESTEYGLVLSFVDQSPSFVHGWEAGQLYQQFQTDGAHSVSAWLEGRLLAWANREMVERILAHYHVGYTIEPVESPEDAPHWFILRDVYHDPKPVRPNLTLVS